MNTITVNIPNSKDPKEPITMYAEGILIHKEYFEGNNILTFNGDYCLNVYYKFPLGHRRVYILCSPEKLNNINKIELYRITGKLSMIAELRKRSFDRYKRSVKYLELITKGEIFKLSPQFFWQLADICRRGVNSEFNLINLLKHYMPDVKIDKSVFKKKEEEPEWEMK